MFGSATASPPTDLKSAIITSDHASNMERALLTPLQKNLISSVKMTPSQILQQSANLLGLNLKNEFLSARGGLDLSSLAHQVQPSVATLSVFQQLQNSFQNQEKQETVEKEDSLTRLRKRRIQVAEASRRSRAKRKKEFSSILEKNDFLQEQVAKLKQKLAELENSNAKQVRTQTNSAELLKACNIEHKEQTERQSQSCDVHPAQGINLGLTKSDVKLPVSIQKTIQEESAIKDQTQECAAPKGLRCCEKDEVQIVSFLKARTNAYFDQLKEDYLTLKGKDTELKNQSGEEVSLESILKTFKVKVVKK